MKIRIRGNSIRYRLDQADVAAVQETGKVEEHTQIGAKALHFCIRSRGDLAAPAIQLENAGLHLGIPVNMLDGLLGTEETGIQFSIPNADGSMLKILVEKDFKCVTVRDEDDSHAFENPNAGQNC
ncbi:DUF7009 family protein [Chitinophaga sp. GCM10012297]|uniref:Uncharacterized protein n=1 Tax=Chitinophaga chungangae TaxID=2821488 RepID=A0ABS3Y976_9BACT|nr:hypothetical protein [Chitinophaga chungangae]MBO9151229.1 hypothetical protein [Chitinophaga chungangae]